MQRRLAPLLRLPGKLRAGVTLLRRDPESLARNLLQFTNPALFEQRLTDVLHAVPMHVSVRKDCRSPPTLNVLDTAWTASGMTGGPNTVLNLAYRIARQGIAVRLVATVRPPEITAAWLRTHATALVGGGTLPDIEIASAADAARPLSIGPQDMFLATHWTTALQLQAVLKNAAIRQFFYMLQEFEPGFYAWSSNHARACETFGMDFWPIVNQRLLADYLFAQPIGRLSDSSMRERAVVFEPAVDATIFHPPSPAAKQRRKRLLFYARPTNTRNMFGLGLLALRQAVQDPVFADWEFLSIGSRGSVPDLPLGGGHTLRRAPWFGYAGYGEFLRQSDIMLCPMLSPHTSYPVLEMPACGGIAVTNVFANKTAAELAGISSGIVATEPTVAGLAGGLLRAALVVNRDNARPPSPAVPRSWDDTLDPAAHAVAATFRRLQATPTLSRSSMR